MVPPCYDLGTVASVGHPQPLGATPGSARKQLRGCEGYEGYQGTPSKKKRVEQLSRQQSALNILAAASVWQRVYWG